MNVIVNNETIEVFHNCTIVNLLEHLNYTKSVAVFINGKQILLSQYVSYELKQNDVIRIIKPLGGG